MLVQQGPETEVQDEPTYSHSQFCVTFLMAFPEVFLWKGDGTVTVLFITVIWRLELSVLVAELHLHLQVCIIDVLTACLCF